MLSQCLSTTFKIIHDAYEFQNGDVHRESNDHVRYVPSDVRIVIEGDELKRVIHESDIRRAIIVNDEIKTENIPKLHKQLTDHTNMNLKILCNEDRSIKVCKNI